MKFHHPYSYEYEIIFVYWNWREKQQKFTLKSGSGARLLKVPIINRAPTPADTMLAFVEVLKLNNLKFV